MYLYLTQLLLPQQHLNNQYIRSLSLSHFFFSCTFSFLSQFFFSCTFSSLCTFPCQKQAKKVKTTACSCRVYQAAVSLSMPPQYATLSQELRPSLPSFPSFVFDVLRCSNTTPGYQLPGSAEDRDESIVENQPTQNIPNSNVLGASVALPSSTAIAASIAFLIFCLPSSVAWFRGWFRGLGCGECDKWGSRVTRSWSMFMCNLEQRVILIHIHTMVLHTQMHPQYFFLEVHYLNYIDSKTPVKLP